MGTVKMACNMKVIPILVSLGLMVAMLATTADCKPKKSPESKSKYPVTQKPSKSKAANSEGAEETAEPKEPEENPSADKKEEKEKEKDEDKDKDEDEDKDKTKTAEDDFEPEEDPLADKEEEKEEGEDPKEEADSKVQMNHKKPTMKIPDLKELAKNITGEEKKTAEEDLEPEEDPLAD